MNLQAELSEFKDQSPMFVATTGKDQLVHFCSQTKSGKHYSSAMRKLYYKLLADQTPPAKISRTIQSVLHYLVPEADLSQLHLPRERCAGYMRSDELETISMAHKAAHVCKLAETGTLSLNSDGTTLNQRKLGAAILSGTTLSVNDLPDGSAKTIIEDIDTELAKLRNTAQKLKLPNADSINWTLVSSSSSDSAATQKKLNSLIELLKERDEERFGPPQFSESKELVKNFCAMHLGVNLRVAFLQGVKNASTQAEEAADTGRSRYPVDALVHQFYKLFGKHGTPEYGAGVLNFPDFLHVQAQNVTMNDFDQLYYRHCLKVALERQVGSRYFVTAHNAGKVLFLRKAAIEYLQKTGKNQGNQLEKEVYSKLQDSMELMWLRADALMFYHIYADLMALAKSNDLKKSVLDMGTHYLELQEFLETLQNQPEIASDISTQVFASEERIYGDTPLNHRNHSSCLMTQESLFNISETEREILFPMLVQGAQEMKEKLQSYASTQLPGGLYWNPVDEDVKKVLSTLTPTNDICESILGLNDWITSHIPNMKQSTVSTLVQLKRNHTMSWLDELSSEQQDKIVSYAQTEKRKLVLERKENEQQIKDKRLENIRGVIEKREVAEKKKREEKVNMAKIHQITSVSELIETLGMIDRKPINEKKKTAGKLKIIKEQIKLRKALFEEKIAITFSSKGKQRPVHKIIEEFTTYLSQKCSEVTTHDIRLAEHDPSYIVGKKIHHRFCTQDIPNETAWYTGFVLEYDEQEKHHIVQYEGEKELQCFDLTIDLREGDVVLM